MAGKRPFPGGRVIMNPAYPYGYPTPSPSNAPRAKVITKPGLSEKDIFPDTISRVDTEEGVTKYGHPIVRRSR